VTPVALAVQAPGGDTGVELGGVGGEGLEQVEHVEVEGQARAVVAVDRQGRA
jgi:hypothetical protein